MISNKTLFKVAVYGGFFTASSGLFFHWKIQENIKKSDYFSKAMRILRNHEPAVMLLGEPIKDGILNLDDREKNYCDGLQAQFVVPVKGPKQKGTLYFRAERANHGDPWDVVTMELGLHNDATKRLRILNVSRKET